MSGQMVADRWKIKLEDIVFKEIIERKERYGEHDVYKGDYLGTDVCVKKITRLYKEQDTLTQEIHRELDPLMLNHPNFVQLIGAAESDDGVYIVTEYVPKDMDWNLKVKVAFDVATAMAHLHSNDVIHRDISSKNILVGENWTIKLCDFGLSRKVSCGNKRAHLTLCGTDLYMAPEIIFGMEYNQKADVFSYGILLCEIITRVDIARQLTRKPMDQFELDVENFKILSPRNTPPQFSKLAIRCSAYNPDERPSFVEVLTELKDISNQPAETLRHRKVSISDTLYGFGLSPQVELEPLPYNQPKSKLFPRVKSEHAVLKRGRARLLLLKGSKSLNSLEIEDGCDNTTNEKSGIEEKRERGKRIGISVGKKLKREIFDRFL